MSMSGIRRPKALFGMQFWGIAAFLIGFGIVFLAGCSDESPTLPFTGDAEVVGSQDSDEGTVSGERIPIDGDSEPTAEAGDSTPAPPQTMTTGRVVHLFASYCTLLGSTDWRNANGAVGAPGPNDNQDANAFAYNDIMGSRQSFWALTFDRLILQGGERITGVYVNVNARYDAGTSRNIIRLLVNYQNDAGQYVEITRDTATWSQSSSDDAFRWRMSGYGWNITGLRSNWTAADVCNLLVGARRFGNNDPVGISRARVNAFRITVTTALS